MPYFVVDKDKKVVSKAYDSRELAEQHISFEKLMGKNADLYVEERADEIKTTSFTHKDLAPGQCIGDKVLAWWEDRRRRVSMRVEDTVTVVLNRFPLVSVGSDDRKTANNVAVVMEHIIGLRDMLLTYFMLGATPNQEGTELLECLLEFIDYTHWLVEGGHEKPL